MAVLGPNDPRAVRRNFERRPLSKRERKILAQLLKLAKEAQN